MSRLDDLATLKEQLAAIEHERWADWQRWMHSLCSKGLTGSLTIPPRLVERWDRQIDTPYAELPEEEKHSDREQVDRYWTLIEAYIAAWQQPDQRPDAATISDAMVERGAAMLKDMLTYADPDEWLGESKRHVHFVRTLLNAALSPSAGKEPGGQWPWSWKGWRHCPACGYPNAPENPRCVDCDAVLEAALAPETPDGK